MHAPHVPPSLPGSMRGAGAANRMRAGAIPMLGGPSRELAASRQHELRVATAAAAAMGGGPPVAGMGLVRGRSFRFMCRDQEERLRYQSQAASQLLGTLMVMGACSRSPVGVSVAVEASKMVGDLEKLATAADAVAGGSGFDVDGDGSEKESGAGEGLQAVAGKLPREASLSAEDTRLPAHLHSLAKALASVGAPRDQAVPMPRPVQLPDHLRDIYTLLPGASSSRQAASQRKRRRTEGGRGGLDHGARERDEDREQREQEEQSQRRAREAALLAAKMARQRSAAASAGSGGTAAGSAGAGGVAKGGSKARGASLDEPDAASALLGLAGSMSPSVRPGALPVSDKVRAMLDEGGEGDSSDYDPDEQSDEDEGEGEDEDED